MMTRNFLITTALLFSVAAHAESKVNMTEGLHNLTTEDDAVVITVRKGFPKQASNGCADASLSGNKLTLTRVKSMEQGEFCSIKLIDGDESALVRFHISESDD